MPDVAIPSALARNAVGYWGGAGERWLAGLPALVASVAADWALAVDGATTYQLSINWVGRVTRADGTPAVLKLGVPDDGHIDLEAAALAAFDSRAAVRVLAHDPARGALLLEHAEPGTQASGLVPERDKEATAALIEVMWQLHRPPPAGCPLPDLAASAGADFAGYLGAHPGDRPLPRQWVERAARLLEELCATATDRVVLHGDLHHFNLLRAARQPWLAIDPHGVVGDPGYEIGSLLYNPNTVAIETLLPLLPDRIAQLAGGLAMPAERVVGWGFVKAMLSEVWTVQGGGEAGGGPLAIARQLLPRLP